MALSLTRRGKIFYIRGTFCGQAVYASTGSSQRNAADAFKRQLERRLLKAAEDLDKRTMGEAVEAYIKKGGEERFTGKIVDLLGHMPIDDIKQGVVDEYARKAYPNVKTSSLKRFWYDPIVAITNYAAGLEWTPLRKIIKPKAVRPAPKWASIEWFEAFWPHCSPQLRALTTLLPYTGCRVSEALALTWDRVNLNEAKAYIPDTKTRIPRTIHLPPVVVEHLKVIKTNRSGHIKVFPWGKKDAVNQAIRRAVERANRGRKQKIEYLSSHKLGSHTYATWMRRYGGLDLRGLVGTGRWKDLGSVMIYTHTDSTEDARRADNLPRAKSVQRVPKRRKSKTVSTFGT